MKEHADAGATVDADGPSAYDSLPFEHQTVKGFASEYVRRRARVGGFGSFCSRLKCAHGGTFYTWGIQGSPAYPSPRMRESAGNGLGHQSRPGMKDLAHLERPPARLSAKPPWDSGLHGRYGATTTPIGHKRAIPATAHKLVRTNLCDSPRRPPLQGSWNQLRAIAGPAQRTAKEPICEATLMFTDEDLALVRDCPGIRSDGAAGSDQGHRLGGPVRSAPGEEDSGALDANPQRLLVGVGRWHAAQRTRDA